eukprot:51847_1
MDTLRAAFLLYICCIASTKVTRGANEWPSEYPELDATMLREELCPWDIPKQCFIFSIDKEIKHPVLNGMIDCDSREFDKKLSIITRHYGRPLYKASSSAKCEIQDIFRILCKQPPQDAKELKQYASLSRFFFLPKTPLRTARDTNAFNQLANTLATPRLIFNTIGAQPTKLSDFETVPKALKGYMDYFYRQIYISGSSWNMNRNKRKYENIKQELKVFLSASDFEEIVTDAKELYFKAFDCNYLECKPNNEAILFYDEVNELQLNAELDGETCLKRKHQCSQTSFEKEASLLRSWTPANFAFVEVESAFRIQYPDHWIKNEMNPKAIPKAYTADTKQFINHGMEIKSTAIVTPFEWTLKSDKLERDSKAIKRGFISNPLKELESHQRIKFQGTVSATQVFHVKGKKESELQITKKHEDEYIVSPIFPPLSLIEITWILYNWRFCWIKGFGADQGIKLYAQPPDIIVFGDLTQDASSGVWHMEMGSALHNLKVKMAPRSQIRVYPNCGDAVGKTTDEKDPCEYIYFFDATRIDYSEIEQWNGAEFAPKIEEKYQYLSEKGNVFELGMIVNPLLGIEAAVSINFDVETNDWKNIYLLPTETQIQTKSLFGEHNNARIELIAPSLSSKDNNNPIAMGSSHCFNIKLKSKRKQKKQKKKALQMKDRISMRPLIFPTEDTVKRWREKGYAIDNGNECTSGIMLLSVNELEKSVIAPGLMHFTLNDYQSKTIEFGSFCVYFKLYGEYHVYYEIGSDHWYSRDNYLISYPGAPMGTRLLKPLVTGVPGEVTTNKQVAKLSEKDIYKCYEHKDGFYAASSAKFPQQRSLLKYSSNPFSVKLEVEKPGAVSFEIREFPAPLKIGETTEWITVHVSRAPFHGDFILKPWCKTESKLKFEFKQNAQNFYELEAIQGQNEEAKSERMEPFAFKMKITAPKNLQCFGHFPYKIDWKVKQVVVDDKNDEVNSPPSIFLMVIANDFESLDVHDTAKTDPQSVGDKTYEDGMADPKCVEKYAQREQDEEDLGPKGPNGQLAPPLNEMGKEMDSGFAAAAGDNYDAQEFLKPVTVSDTIRNPAQLMDYLKDYDKLKRYICDHQPEHELCGGARNKTKSANNDTISSLTPNALKSQPLGLWAWQNLVVYSACGVIAIGLIKAIGCCEKSLEKKIIEAQMHAMQPLNQDQ